MYGAMNTGEMRRLLNLNFDLDWENGNAADFYTDRGVVLIIFMED